ncbi:ligatin, putative [Phytophthora infestans T30-4]|uniref:Ligatin, putative n=2 Tax=Phytophthora infestans TaxID=4787 RepID=D0N7K5_PHYIT|nr:ligatin, putative [Phytophthora infestans T30-4]EEY53554.1 ligatin, putative [Phytophthora infestans T30-4]KAF4038048.1 Translation initiation factor SUI1 [Phytophthora infestans]KAF4140745.1 Translation initiation factor SUI1 [Phytophthora infestans]|eukprot:XP_002905172.1 ligatin, putative [Phytophthora infestans T30-4]
MFAKPAKVSGNVLLKNKDAKKLRRDVAVCFKGTCDGPDDVNLKQLLASKASVKKMSFQAPSRVVVYASEETKEPLIFDTSGKGDLCFSVYALWRFPALLPPLVVHAPVSEFVLRGADVMLPGVVFTSEEQLQSLRKGELRAVYARGNPCAIGVGEMLVDAAEVERSGKKGRALKLWHVVGDSLWQMGPQTLPNEGFLGEMVVPIEGDDEDAGVTLEGVTLEEEKEEKEEEQVTKQQMDSYYVAALLQALRTGKIRDKELPILASSFHAQVLLPCRRAGVSLNIKHSSFKKLSVFLKVMAAHGLLAVTDNDGVQSITEIARRHPDVLSHEPYQTDEEAQQDEQAAANKAAGLPAFVPGQYAPEVEECIGLSPALKTLLPLVLPNASAGQPLQKYWSAAEIRDLVTQYVESQGLVDATDKKFVRLNGSLTDALYGKKEPAGGYPERLTRPEILNLLLSKCTHYHRIKLFPTHAAKFHGGNLKPITIHAAKLKRRNNTTVTYIAFYQQFGIDGEAFAKEAQKKWGCSAAVLPSEDKSKGEEIQIHGHMVNEVLEYLATKYRINAKYCTVTYGKDVKAKKKK